MLLERQLRQFSVGQRIVAIAMLLLLPMVVLSAVSAIILNDQETAFRDSVEESIHTLLPLTTLEHYLQRALVDELEAQSNESIPDFGGLTDNIDNTFSNIESSDHRGDLPEHTVLSAQQAWRKARPSIKRLIEQVRSLHPRDGRAADNLDRQELQQSIREIGQARRELALLVQARYMRAVAARHSQLRWLMWSWIITLSAAALLLAAFLHSLLRPIREIGQAAQSLGAGKMGIRLPVTGNDELTALGERFNAMAEQWEASRQTLLTEAAEDPLTGMLNRRGILASLEAELDTHTHRQQPLSIFMVDLNRFKAINDQFGHSAGDRALQWVAAKMRESLRDTDRAGRYGGDEFLIILPDADKTQARQIAQRMMQSIDHAAGREPAYPTVSIGIANAPEDGRDIATLIEVADAALYGAKSRRRHGGIQGDPATD